MHISFPTRAIVCSVMSIFHFFFSKSSYSHQAGQRVHRKVWCDAQIQNRVNNRCPECRAGRVVILADV